MKTFLAVDKQNGNHKRKEVICNERRDLRDLDLSPMWREKKLVRCTFEMHQVQKGVGISHPRVSQ